MVYHAAMKKIFAVLLCVLLFPLASFSETPSNIVAELDAYWAEVSRSVREGDFKGYTATTHADGVLVAGTHDR